MTLTRRVATVATVGSRMSTARWWITVVLLALVAARLDWLITFSYQYMHVDIGVYRMGGRALLDGNALYDTSYEVNGLPFTYTPFAAIAFVPLALLSFEHGVIVFTAVSLVMLARVCWLLGREVVRHLPVVVEVHEAALALFFLGLSLEPVIETVGQGQVNLVILWLVLEDLLSDRQHKLSGVGIGLATGIKLVPGLFIVYLLVTGGRRSAVRAVVVALGTVVAGFLVQPGQAWRYWTGVAYDSSRVGTLSYVSNQSLNGLFNRLTEGGGRAAWTVLVVPILAAGLWAARRLYRAGAPVSSISAVALVSLLVSPVSWSHHWVWLVPMFAAAVELSVRSRWVLLFTLPIVWVGWFAPIWWSPSDKNLEYGYVGVDRVWANAYVVLGVTLLVAMVWGCAQLAPPSRRAGHTSQANASGLPTPSR